MQDYPGNIRSKLSDTGISIFAVMSQLAMEYDAINLSQGFPDFPISAELIDLIHHYMKKGYNQYAPMPGVPALRMQISKKVKKTYGAFYNPDTEINISAGATQAIYTAISAFIKEDDEAIIFEPAYDCYAPSIKLNGGLIKYARLKQGSYAIDWDELPRLITHKTRLIIINTPHNPTGSILSAEDMERLQTLTRNTDIIVISDEVYEHLIYDGFKHYSACVFPELARRSIITGSFGKTFHATGWKMGFVLAPEKLMKEYRKAHQFVVFACNTPIQYALADYLQVPAHYNSIADMYEKKRTYFAKKLQKSRFELIPSCGTYFQVLDYHKISGEKEMDFAVKLIKEHGIASIPLSSFYHDNKESARLRFCFAKQEETLDKAAEILCKI